MIDPTLRVSIHLNHICDDAGYRTMRGIFDVIQDREQVSTDQLLALKPADIQAYYDLFIERAVDDIEAAIHVDTA